MVRKYKRVDRPHRPKTLHNNDSRDHAIRLMHEGLNTKRIAEETGISERQIRHYRENLKDFGAILAPKRKDAGDHENILDFSQSKEGQLFKVGKRNKPLKPPPVGEKPKPREISDAEREAEVHPVTRALVVQAHIEFGIPQPECVIRFGLRTQKAVQAIVNRAKQRAEQTNRPLLWPTNFTDSPLIEESMIHARRGSGSDEEDQRPKLPQQLEFILCENGDIPDEIPRS